MSELLPNNGDVNKTRLAIRKSKVGDSFLYYFPYFCVFKNFFQK